MGDGANWSRRELLIAFKLYCQIPFGKMHSRNPEIIRYSKLIGRTPSSLAMKLSNIASLDPEITSTGRKGLKGASASDKAMWKEMQSNWESFINEVQIAENYFGFVNDTIGTDDRNDDRIIDESIDYTGINKDAKVSIRVGQNFFRHSVLSAYDNRCCITGLAIPKLLIASHIIPWSVDTKNRLNPSNGLCLSMLHDKAFDTGIITITRDMTVCVSKKYSTVRDVFFWRLLIIL